MNLRFKEKGVTLVEIAVSIAILGVFASVLVADFPNILRRFALSRATYKLAQDFRRVQDFGLSGILVAGVNSINATGYGIYLKVNPMNDKTYIIYADSGNAQYDGDTQLCSDVSVDPNLDCVLEEVDLTQENPDLYIKELVNIEGNHTSVNFAPPNPDISITNLASGYSEAGIVLGVSIEPDLERTVWVNSSGLIRIE